jgi:hypothetical protein
VPRASPYPGLRRTDELAILILVVLEFLFWGGPVWRRFANWDQAIGWSYLSIPLLVLAGLLLRGRLHWLPWLLHSIEIVGVKFAITATVLIAVMVGRGEAPLGRIAPIPSAPLAPALATPVPRVMGRVPGGGAISGVLRGADGSPAQGWVWLSALKLPLSEAPEAKSLSLTERSDGLAPRFFLAEVGQPFQIHSVDGRLHTARVLQGTRWLFNIPVPAEGQSPVRFIGQPGEAEIGCTVHGRAERPAHALVLDHPFFAHTDAQGGFTISDVPPGPLRLNACDEDGEQSSPLDVTAAPGAIVHIDPKLAPTP